MIDRRTFLAMTATGVAAVSGCIDESSAGDDGATNIVTDTYDDELFFNPVGILIEPGSKLVFQVMHPGNSVTAHEDRIPTDADPWDTGMVEEEGQKFSKTFDVEGTYDFYSKGNKKDMIGRIVVGEPGGPAEDAPLDEGKYPYPSSELIMEKGWIGTVEYRGLCC